MLHQTPRPEIFVIIWDKSRERFIDPPVGSYGRCPSINNTSLVAAKQTTVGTSQYDVIGFQIDFSFFDKISCLTNEVTKKGCRRIGSCSGIRLPKPIYPPTPAWKKEREKLEDWGWLIVVIGSGPIMSLANCVYILMLYRGRKEKTAALVLSRPHRRFITECLDFITIQCRTIKSPYWFNQHKLSYIKRGIFYRSLQKSTNNWFCNVISTTKFWLLHFIKRGLSIFFA